MRDPAEKSVGRMADPVKEQLAHARGRYTPEDREKVAEIVAAVITTMSGDLSSTETSLGLGSRTTSMISKPR